MTPSPARRLRDLVEGGAAVICPGVTDPLFASMAERQGHRMVFATGAGIANAQYGLPDIGLIGMSEVLDVVRRICARTALPVLADVDTGYGGVLNVTRTVQEFERAGVAGVVVEDQRQPKRCGHLDGKEVVPAGEMVERVVAALEARSDPDLVLVARTDAVATGGLGDAIERANRYREAGADVLFVEAPTSEEDLRAIRREVQGPLLVNMVEGGRTPLLPLPVLEEIGYTIVLYANAVLRMAMAAGQRALAELAQRGGTARLAGEMLSWQDRQGAVDLDGWTAIDERVAGRAGSVPRPG